MRVKVMSTVMGLFSVMTIDPEPGVYNTITAHSIQLRRDGIEFPITGGEYNITRLELKLLEGKFVVVLVEEFLWRNRDVGEHNGQA